MRLTMRKHAVLRPHLHKAVPVCVHLGEAAAVLLGLAVLHGGEAA